ncbi:MAG: DUF1214 domain-containing protein [Zhengella sp.]|uniref:DUF1214 domain-containing protein n=1 Tax=Zhengella sp. TaxID=2282762 RepID=UPI001DED3714|nr:DUF1214 domain-containing protein [Notoacmeibacter sp.]MCC0026345.1 DUF1214 domain-containing protein [Brucellaceae bacterium]
MIRNLILAALALAIAFGGGGWSVWALMNSEWRPGALQVGPWIAYVQAGTPGADPYTKARIARNAELPLGAGEGVAFSARRDTAGDPLRPECRYRIEGGLPPARLWTVHVADQRMRPVHAGPLLPSARHSRDVLYNSDGSVSIHVSRRPAPGNWLALSAPPGFHLVMTFYDGEISASTAAREIAMPQILNEGCDG